MEAPAVSHPTDRPNFTRVTVGPVRLFFSYETVVGFTGPGEPEWVTSENLWGPTTGKHLNYIEPDKARRVSRFEFDHRLTAMLDRIDVGVPA